jgi:hypothetical protein
VNFLDLDVTVVYSSGSADFAFKVYRKPGTAYVYLPYGSYHARHVFRGWLKAEMHRLLTHSSNPTIWLDECAVFYSHLRNRGYPSRAINATFRKVNWNQHIKMLETRKRDQDEDKFFAQYRACVFSNRNEQGIAELRARMDLSLKELQNKARGATSYPPLPSSHSRARSRWDIFCLGDIFAISMGALLRPQSRGYSRPLL